ncbi:hypothetical protein BDC45DRAFT_606959 [Circinella umbellata]|nr:hypothetical protein BDC45DRAFT_606959 [Circinella umbellata]
MNTHFILSQIYIYIFNNMTSWSEHVMTDPNGMNITATKTSAISMHRYWQSTIQTCEAAIGLLSAFDHCDHYLVDNALGPLRQLVGRGRNYEAMKAYRPTHTTTTTTTTTTTNTSPSFNNNNTLITSPLQKQQQQQQQLRKTIQLNFNPRENWTIEDAHTIRVHTNNNKTNKKTEIICKAIVTLEQLDAALPAIEKAPCLGLDCEFLGVKKSLPELQVLQIAISSTEGYAVMVNHIGAQAVYQKLGPILEQEFLTDQEIKQGKRQDDGKGRLLLGWAFKADAQAIEASFKKIKLTRVLDLQAKMQTLATEQLSLHNAMRRYCHEWNGLDEFLKAKQLGDTFQFTGPDCVWLYNPLPPEALVYAVFDVVSLVALHQETTNYPNHMNHYWPNTITSTYGRKALEKWLRQKVMSQHETIAPPFPSSPHQEEGNAVDFMTLVETPAIAPPTPQQQQQQQHQQSIKKQGKAKQITSSAWDDENPKFTADIEEAMRRSRNEYNNNQHPHASEERIIGTLDESNGSSSSFPCETIDYNDMPAEYTNYWDEDPHPLQQQQKQHIKEKINEQENFINDSQDEFENPPFETTTNDRLHFANDIYDDSNTKHKDIGQLGGWGSPDEVEETNYKDNQQQQEQQHQNTNYFNIISQKFHQHAEGEFLLTMRPEDQTWSQLAEDSKKGWKAGVDSTADWKEMARRTAKEEENQENKDDQQQQPSSSKFHTVPHFNVGSWAYEKDSWDKKDEQPQIMQMPLRNFPKMKTSHRQRGPRVTNPFDYGTSSDEDDSSQNNSSHEDEESMDDTDDSNSIYGTRQQKEKDKKGMNTMYQEPVEDTYLENDLHLEKGDIVQVHLIKNYLQLSTVEVEKKNHYHSKNENDNKQQEEEEEMVVFITPLLREIFPRDGSVEIVIKAIQLFIMPSGQSYTLLISSLLNHMKEFRQSELGHLFVDPNVKRVVWGMSIVEHEIQEKLGFAMGRAIDLACVFTDIYGTRSSSDNMNNSEYHETGSGMTFTKAMHLVLKNQKKNMEAYQELKQFYKSKDKFSGSPLDQDRLKINTVHYCAMQGWVLYELYQFLLMENSKKQEKIDLNDYIMPPLSNESNITYTISHP